MLGKQLHWFQPNFARLQRPSRDSVRISPWRLSSDN